MPSRPPTHVDERLQRLEEEYGALQQDVAEILERQDFTERALLRPPSAPHEEIPTPRRAA
jgi:hypothetical protein